MTARRFTRMSVILGGKRRYGQVTKACYRAGSVDHEGGTNDETVLPGAYEGKERISHIDTMVISKLNKADSRAG